MPWNGGAPLYRGDDRIRTSPGAGNGPRAGMVEKGGRSRPMLRSIFHHLRDTTRARPFGREVVLDA
jgi:hypothetical protein